MLSGNSAMHDLARKCNKKINLPKPKLEYTQKEKENYYI